jgi:hypothetical protein
MIYLIRSIETDVDTKEVYDIVKIGYTKDENSKKRFDTYYLHNPHCKVIYTIPEGTELHEKQIHKKFNKYKHIRQEWFSFNEEVIKFFKENKTSEDLDKSLNINFIPIDSTEERNLKLEIRKYFNYYFCKYSKDIDGLNEINNKQKEILNKYFELINKRIFKIEDFIKIFKEDYNIEMDLIEDYKKFQQELIATNPTLISEFINKFNNKLTQFSQKMRYLCEFIEDTKLDVVLESVPLTYKNYYNSIGPKRCKAFCYQKNKLDEELALQKFEVNNMVPEIHNTFKDGEVYSLADIKEKLKQIYSTYNYNKTAKATDIEFYFDINSCSRRVEGKLIKCYKILNKKIEYKVD